MSATKQKKQVYQMANDIYEVNVKLYCILDEERDASWREGRKPRSLYFTFFYKTLIAQEQYQHYCTKYDYDENLGKYQRKIVPHRCQVTENFELLGVNPEWIEETEEETQKDPEAQIENNTKLVLNIPIFPSKQECHYNFVQRLKKKSEQNSGDQFNHIFCYKDGNEVLIYTRRYRWTFNAWIQKYEWASEIIPTTLRSD